MRIFKKYVINLHRNHDKSSILKKTKLKNQNTKLACKSYKQGGGELERRFMSRICKEWIHLNKIFGGTNFLMISRNSSAENIPQNKFIHANKNAKI